MMSIAAVHFHEIQPATGWEKNHAELQLANLLLHLAKRFSCNQGSGKLANVKRNIEEFPQKKACNYSNVLKNYKNWNEQMSKLKVQMNVKW